MIFFKRTALESLSLLLYKFYTVDLVIFACLNFRKFPILGLFTKFRIGEFAFVFSSNIIRIIFARFLNSRISRKLKFANITRSTVFIYSWPHESVDRNTFQSVSAPTGSTHCPAENHFTSNASSSTSVRTSLLQTSTSWVCGRSPEFSNR